jgi:Rieske Fe-S protein
MSMSMNAPMLPLDVFSLKPAVFKQPACGFRQSRRVLARKGAGNFVKWASVFGANRSDLNDVKMLFDPVEYVAFCGHCKHAGCSP